MDMQYTGDGEVTIQIPTALKNPKALTINGVSYDGSAAVDMTIQGGGEPIPEYVKTEADRVAKLVQSRQNANTITALICSDLHTGPGYTTSEQMRTSIKHCGQGMALIRNAVHIDFAAMLGDVPWDGGESTEGALEVYRFVNDCLQDAFNGIPGFRARGNHECLYNTAGGLNDEQIFANIGKFNAGAVFDPNNRLGGYCYRDFPDYKIRVICVNTCEDSGGGFAVSAAQNTWLKSVLDLSAKGADWRSMVVCHHPPDWVSSSSNLVRTLKAASGLIAVFHGHVHGFKVDTIPGTEIIRIAIPNACFGRENEYGTNGTTENNEGTEFGETTTYSKKAGTAEDTAFCVITIDLAEKKIYADHYGAGYDRVIAYNDAENIGGYTNLVPTAQALESTSPYNGTGYKDGYRLSSASPFESAASGYVITGYIPYEMADGVIPGAIYIKGADWNEVSNCRLTFFTEAKTAATGPLIQGGGSGNAALSTHFTVETLGDDHFRLVPIVDGDEWICQNLVSSIVYARFFRISLAGSGANLIITVDEPIE